MFWNVWMYVLRSLVFGWDDRVLRCAAVVRKTEHARRYR